MLVGPVRALPGIRNPIDGLAEEGYMRKTASRSAAAIWLIAILAACGQDSSGTPTGPSGEPACKTIQLVPGEDVIFEGSAAVSCIDIPAFEAQTRYEVVVSTMSRTLGFSPMELRVSPKGTPVGSAGMQTDFTSTSPSGSVRDVVEAA